MFKLLIAIAFSLLIVAPAASATPIRCAPVSLALAGGPEAVPGEI